MSTLFVFARCGTWSIGKLQVFSEWFVKSLNWRCRKHLPVLYGHPSCDFRWTRSYRISFFVLVGRADLLPILPITLSLLEWFMNIKIWHKGKRNPLDERTPVETFMVRVADHEHSGPNSIRMFQNATSQNKINVNNKSPVLGRSGRTSRTSELFRQLNYWFSVWYRNKINSFIQRSRDCPYESIEIARFFSC